MIKNVIFDIGNVLAKFRYKEFIEDLGFGEEVNERLTKATVLSRFWQEHDRGILTLDEVVEGCIGLDPDIEDEIRTFFKDRTELVVEYDYAKWLVSAYKKSGYKVYLLSNYSEDGFARIRDVFTFIGQVDGMVISSEVKSIKPEVAMYATMLERYGLNPDECVFVDDLEENVRTADRLGIHTVHFKGIKEAIKELKSLGVTLKFDGIIFDLDGTLLDSTELGARVWNEEARKRGVEINYKDVDVRKFYGLPLKEIAFGLFPDIDKGMAIEIMQSSVKVQAERIALEGGILFDGVEGTIRELGERCGLFIVSNCEDGYIEAFLKYYGFERYFKDMECPGRTGLYKAENIRLVIKRNGLRNPLYVGDTKGDKDAAMAAGVPFLHAGYGFGTMGEGDVAISSIGELLEMVQGM